MAVTPDTNLRLLKCDLSIDKSNQINFSTSTDQYNYFNSLTKLTGSNYSYQRKDSVIRYPAHIDSIIEYNYVMYQNHNYSNKWFYAYITRMEYINDNMTAIYIKTDVFQTWQFNLTYKKSFVEREHVNDDTVGKNTVPEKLETGEYIINDTDYMMYDTNYAIIIVLSSARDTGLYTTQNSHFGHVFNGCKYYGFGASLTQFDEANKFIRVLDDAGKTDNVVSVFMCPDTLYQKINKNSHTDTIDGITVTYDVLSGSSGLQIENQKYITMQTTLNGYTPKNNKLKCFPYNYLELDNNNGGTAVYHYEKFVNNTPSFQTSGTLTIGCSIMCVPLNYNLKTDDHILISGMLYSWSDGIPAGKYPVGSWSSDSYTNWLTQNGTNVALKVGGGIAAAVGGALTLNPVVAAGGVAAIFSTAAEVYQHSLTPDQASGNLNSGDITYSKQQTMFAFKKKSIKYEYAKIIDDFFSMFGYKVNAVKVPNITGRSNWNYVKMIDPNIEGHIPQEDLQEIKQMFSDGVTIWHTTSHFLDYSQTNSII